LLNNTRLVSGWLTALIGAAALLATPSAHARSTFVSPWLSLYPSSDSLNNATPDGCQLCHATAGGDGRNAYGTDMDNVLPSRPTTSEITAALTAIESLDSDSDPTSSSNLVEIDANTQPGWAEGDTAPNIIGDLDPSIEEQPPVADANGPYAGTAGTPVLFDASGSWDPNDNIATYEWLFGDGTAVTVDTATVNHTYAVGGMYGVTLTVTDALGLNNSDTTTANINTPADFDSDGIPDGQDNCIEAPNGPAIPDAGGNSQLDTDGDGYGNLCDADLVSLPQGDGFVDDDDLTQFSNVFFTPDLDADHNGDGFVDYADLTLFSNMFLQPPGPSCCGIPLP